MKIIHNVTIIIDHSVHDEWLSWMKEIHIPEVLATGMFSSCRILKVVEEHNPDGHSYAMQYLSPSRAQYDTYQEKFAPIMRAKVEEKFAGKYGAFRTCLELIEEV
jgi:hypothetical protein